MSQNNTAPTSEQLHQIVEEQRLGYQAEAFVNDQGQLIIVQNTTKPEAEQQFVCLNREQRNNLRHFLKLVAREGH